MYHIGLRQSSVQTNLGLDYDVERWQSLWPHQRGMRPMVNRIRELRKARGWTQEVLADRVGTTQQQLGRLEKETRRLTRDWMEKIAIALDVRPNELFTDDDILADVSTSDLSTVSDETVGGIAQALARRGLRVYRVEADSVTDSGLERGKIITVDETPAGINDAKTGDIVVVEAGSESKQVLLRVFVRPSLVTTNRATNNSCFRLDNPAMEAHIRGVVIWE